ncbi:MAG: SoxR reducing system RseC family protein, partial [bacterium]
SYAVKREKIMEQGIVTSIKGNKAILRTELEVHTEFCPEEVERSGDIVLLEVDNSIGARIGQKVRLETIGYQKVIWAVIFFVIPTIALVLGVGQGIYWADRWGLSQKVGELSGITFGFILVGIIYLVAGLYKQQLRRKGKSISRIIEIINE